jgi:hypothetical protein
VRAGKPTGLWDGAVVEDCNLVAEEEEDDEEEEEDDVMPLKKALEGETTNGLNGDVS